MARPKEFIAYSISARCLYCIRNKRFVKIAVWPSETIDINLVMRRDSSFRKTLRTAEFRTLAYAYILKSLISARDS